jgi:hypothetical protein
LNAAHREFLRSRPVAFVFIAGWDEGLDLLRASAKAVGLDATVFAHLTDKDIPFAFDGVLTDQDPTAVKAFQETAKAVGESLLAFHKKEPAKIRSRALGYGNRAMLLASRLNVPSQTLTCLWMDGKHDNVDWHALIRRRRKE